MKGAEKNNIKHYAHYSAEEILIQLKSSSHGLTQKEARDRLAKVGMNEIVHKRTYPLIWQAILFSANPLVGILLIAAVISGITGNPVNAAIIIFMIVLSVGLVYFQTHRSFLAAKRLQAKVALTVTVIRDGQVQEIPTCDIVPGDVVKLSAGNMIPADAILLNAKDLHVQQSALTGEALPVEKEVISKNKSSNVFNVFDQLNLVFAGTSVVSGNATAVIVSTGPNTMFGQIATTLEVKPPQTEFEKGILRFSLLIMKTVIFLVLFVFAIGALYKHNPLEALLFATALAVGLTPEFLPMITTVTLASGAIRMSHEGVIVKNLAAIQNFGSINILCSDKTGTLTTGEMVLEQHVDFSGKSSQYVLLLAYLNSLFESEVVTSIKKAVLHRTHINPLDFAILKHDHPSVQSYHKVDEIPFDFERRRSSVVVRKGDADMLITKGAPEHIFKICTHYDDGEIHHLFSSPILQECETVFRKLSNQGYRVLALAYRPINPKAAYTKNDEIDLVFSGFLVFFDPPIKEVEKVIQNLSKEGVTLKILTGDSELVAKHVSEQVGFDPGEIILGDQIDKMSDIKLAKIAEQTHVFARLSPAQKQRIIRVLRDRGHVVGYIGDGINDAPSLHSADVGISVAEAVDVAKATSDIILHKHNLKALLHGILEGRKSFGNVMKYLMMGTSSNFGNVFSMAGAILFLPFLPMLPAQILLNNLLYDMAQVTIPTDHVDETFIRKPRKWNIDIIRRFMFYIGPISSIFDFLTFYGVCQHSCRLFSPTGLSETGFICTSFAGCQHLEAPRQRRGFLDLANS